MTIEFDYEKLLNTYGELVHHEYKAAIVALINHDNNYRPPDINVSEANVLTAAEHVQACSQYYTFVCELSAHSKSAFKLAEAKYKQAFRVSIGNSDGKNAEAREAYAAAETKDELETMAFFESAMILFSSMEQSARVAADSSRKIADLIHSLHITDLGNRN